MPADKPRNVGFCIHGHVWREQQQDSYSRIIPLQGAISIGNTFQMELKDGASCPGDYLYRSGSLKWDVESGMWGIFRVLKRNIGCKCKNACRKVLDCMCRWLWRKILAAAFKYSYGTVCRWNQPKNTVLQKSGCHVPKNMAVRLFSFQKPAGSPTSSIHLNHFLKPVLYIFWWVPFCPSPSG